jgi:hypothetical protein
MLLKEANVKKEGNEYVFEAMPETLWKWLQNMQQLLVCGNGFWHGIYRRIGDACFAIIQRIIRLK